jgi:two-component sensor histidine kinase
LNASVAYLRPAFEQRKVLINEIDHRVENSLQLVTILLSQQASIASEPAPAHHPRQATSRVSAVSGIQRFSVMAKLRLKSGSASLVRLWAR